MTPHLTQSQHLARFIWLMEPPYRNQFRKECWEEALRLASNAEYAVLPDLLKAAMKGKPNENAHQT